MASVLRVSRSGFYHWIINMHKESQRNHRRKQLDQAIKDAFNESKERDGAGVSKNCRRTWR